MAWSLAVEDHALKDQLLGTRVQAHKYFMQSRDAARLLKVVAGLVVFARPKVQIRPPVFFSSGGASAISSLPIRVHDQFAY